MFPSRMRPSVRFPNPRSRRAALTVEALEDRRVLDAGALDTTFGTGGLALIDVLGSAPDTAAAVLAQADGKTVVVGTSTVQVPSPSEIIVATRYLANGSLDSTFGVGGIARATLPFGQSVAAADAVLQADGKIVVGGSVGGTAFPFDFLLTRFNADGSLDASFGSGGFVTTDIDNFSNDAGRAVALQSDGKIVLAGTSGLFANPNFALARYNADGSLDTTFGGGDGIVTTDVSGAQGGFEPSIDEATDVALASGKIVVVGTFTDPFGGTGSDWAVARYNGNGTLDTGFSGDGVVVADIAGSNDVLTSVAVQGNNKIVVGGSVTSGFGSVIDFAVARFNTNGSFDTSFSGDGIQTTDVSGSFDEVKDLAIQSNGKIVAAGIAGPGVRPRDFGAVRYNTNGTLDTTFSGDGIQTTDFGGAIDNASAVALFSSGKIVVAGSTGREDRPDLAVARYNANGTLDTTFSGDGRATTDVLTSGFDSLGDIAVAADGKIVSAGFTLGGSSLGFTGNAGVGVARSLPDGAPDTTFGIGGAAAAFFGDFGVTVTAVEVLSNGKVLVFGSATNAFFQNGAFVAKFNADGSLDTTFGDSGSGRVFTGFSGLQGTGGMVVQADGKIVVSVTALNDIFNSDIILTRYTSAGVLDTTFFGFGVVHLDLNGDEVVGDLTQAPNGKLVVVGTYNFFNPQTFEVTVDFVVGRFLADGTPDVAFGTDGATRVDFGGRIDRATAVVVADNNDVIVGGTTDPADFSTPTDWALARLRPNGQLRTSFGTQGRVITDFGGHSDQLTDLALVDDDIAAAGTTTDDFGNPVIALALYEDDGELDDDFGDDGQVTYTFTEQGGPAFNSRVALAVQPTRNDALVIGTTTNGQGATGADFALARFLSDDSAGASGGGGYGAFWASATDLYRAFSGGKKSQDAILL